MNEISDAPTEVTAQHGERLHISGLFIGFVSGLPQLLFPLLAAVFGARKSDNPALIPIMIAAVLAISLFFRWLGWRRFRYHVGADDIRVEKGILNRTARSIPYERIQDVSIQQKPLEGVSMAYLFDEAEAEDRHTTQYFEIGCNRGIYHDGWTAMTMHRLPWPDKRETVGEIEDDTWELYGPDDWTQAHNIADQNPDMLRKLQESIQVFITTRFCQM